MENNKKIIWITCLSRADSRAPEKRGYPHNIFIISPWKGIYICCGYSLEVPRWVTSNEYSQHTFWWRNKKNTSKFQLRKCPVWSYELCVCYKNPLYIFFMTHCHWAHISCHNYTEIYICYLCFKIYVKFYFNLNVLIARCLLYVLTHVWCLLSKLYARNYCHCFIPVIWDNQCFVTVAHCQCNCGLLVSLNKEFLPQNWRKIKQKLKTKNDLALNKGVCGLC